MISAVLKLSRLAVATVHSQTKEIEEKADFAFIFVSNLQQVYYLHVDCGTMRIG